MRAQALARKAFPSESIVPDTFRQISKDPYAQSTISKRSTPLNIIVLSTALRSLPSLLPSTCQAPALARVSGRFCENSPFEIDRGLSTPGALVNASSRLDVTLGAHPNQRCTKHRNHLSHLYSDRYLTVSLDRRPEGSRLTNWRRSALHQVVRKGLEHGPSPRHRLKDADPRRELGSQLPIRDSNVVLGL